MKKTQSLRDFKNAFDRRRSLEKRLEINLDNIGSFTFAEEQATGRNIENLIGATQIPMGVAGPIKLRTLNSELRTHYIPLATTEGALVASVSRGCRAITESGGATVYVEEVGITRGPVFKTKNLSEAIRTKTWMEKNFRILTRTTESTSSHLKLLKADYTIIGRNLFVRFYFDSQDAMGMNMATIATESMVKIIEQKTKAVCISVAGNFDIDKKPAWLNFISGRGKRVWAEVVLDKTIIKEVLKTTSQKIADLVYRKCLLGSAMSGSLGFNAHFANIAAAVFAATGQDLAHVVEASLGITTAEVVENESLFFSIYLPSLVCGVVGGGTQLPTQKEALEIMKISDVLEYSQVLGAAILAGELSLIASLTEGTLAKAHQKLGRKGK